MKSRARTGKFEAADLAVLHRDGAEGGFDSFAAV